MSIGIDDVGAVVKTASSSLLVRSLCNYAEHSKSVTSTAGESTSGYATSSLLAGAIAGDCAQLGSAVDR